MCKDKEGSIFDCKIIFKVKPFFVSSLIFFPTRCLHPLVQFKLEDAWTQQNFTLLTIHKNPKNKKLYANRGEAAIFVNNFLNFSTETQISY